MYDDIIARYAAMYSVPIAWINAVIAQESSGDPNAYRAEPQIGDASYGLMQVLYKTAKGLGYMGLPNGLYDPDTNIQLGTKLIGEIRRNVGDDAEAMYSAYNSGDPTAYLSDSTVASHVASFMNRLGNMVGTTIGDNPEASGGLGALIVVTLVFYYMSKKR